MAAKKKAENEVKDALSENTIAVEDAGTLKKKVTVTVPAERITAKRDEMFGELSGSAQIPGFRIGHAPRRLIEKRFGKDIANDVRNSLIGEALGQAVEKAQLKTVGEPDINLDTIELPDAGEMTFSFEVELFPEFNLPELKGIAVQKKVVTIDDARVDEQLEQFRSSRARYEETDGAAEEGDQIAASAVISGEGIERIERPGLMLRVAAGQVEAIPLVDMGKELAGKKAGDQVTLTVKVPDSHPNEAWRGKDATVEISVGTVRRRIVPEMNDEFALQAGFDSIAEMRQFIQRNLQGRAVTETQQAMREQIQTYLLDSTTFDLPEGVVKRHAAGVLRRRYVDLLYAGVPAEKIDENMAQLQAAASDQARRDLKLSFILGKIADEQKIEIGDDEVNARVAAMAQQYNRRPERMRQELESDGSISQVQVALLEEKVLDKLLADATISEVAPEAAEAEKPKAKKARAKKAASDDKAE